ncbi:MAG: hypothetical protein ABIM30_07780 [candidate division WOR-3 bacterium]
MKKFVNLVDIGFVGYGNANHAYGGYLLAYSMNNVCGQEWFNSFQDIILDFIGKRYLPIYRMADGEFDFLFGPVFNYRKKHFLKDLAVYIKKWIRFYSLGFETSWGENYSLTQILQLRKKLISDLQQISTQGYLALYFNKNGHFELNTLNKTLEKRFQAINCPLTQNNYVPFHFVCNLLMQRRYLEFFSNKNILLVSGFTSEDREKIKRNLSVLTPKNLEFINTSKTHSMLDSIELEKLHVKPDIAFVAAGVGSANIISQLSRLNCPCIDIGGLMKSFISPSFTYHGNVFGFPGTIKL